MRQESTPDISQGVVAKEASSAAVAQVVANAGLRTEELRVEIASLKDQNVSSKLKTVSCDNNKLGGRQGVALFCA